MQGGDTTREIEERLSERLLAGEEEDDDLHHSQQMFRIDGSSGIHHHHHEDISATTIMESGGEIIVDSGNGGFAQQPLRPVYRDAPFALAFLAHLGLVFFFAVAWGIKAMRYTYTYDDNDNDYRYPLDADTVEEPFSSLSGLVWLSCFTCFFSIGLSAVSLQVMMHHAETLIQCSLIGSCVFMAITVLLLLLDGVFVLAFGWTLGLLVTAWYAHGVWHRIPFASANLRTALSAIQTNAGICVLAYGIVGLANLWTILWSMAVVGVAFHEETCYSSGICKPHINPASMLLLLLSYYWTIQVFQNVLHVTVSGVVGTWWFAPQDALSVFSPAILDSFRRATTYSFGSICMGSLLVAIVQTLEAMARSARQNNRGGALLLCILECILSLVARIAMYFNKWAYCYVGLYGFDYISSGKKAMDLFQAKGWTAIVTDNLIQRSLTLVALVVGASCGFLVMLLAKATGWATPMLGEVATNDGAVFLVFSVIATSMALILNKVVLSAVDTVIVAFAEAPAEFQTHHPALSNNMIQKWRMVFPDECGF
jgi:hypothetical protein